VKCRTFSQFAVCPDPACLTFYQLLADVKSEAGSHHPPSFRLTQSGETSEESRHLVRAYPVAVVADGDLDLRSRATRTHLDRSGSLRELQRIREEVRDDTPCALLVALDVRQFAVDNDLDRALRVKGAYLVDRPLDEVGEFERLQREREVTGLDAGHLEHVVDEADQTTGVVADPL